MKAFSYGIIPYLFTDDGVSIMLSLSSSGMKSYGFVKGKIDPGETPKECCIREVFEEIGVEINIDDLEDLIIQKNPKKNVGLFYINWNKYSNIKIKLDTRELYSINWFNVSNLPTITKNQRLIISNIFVKFNKLNFYQRKRKD
jgi:8-oxo-dGTP pyrophosphatase MutT (NUDIX family)